MPRRRRAIAPQTIREVSIFKFEDLDNRVKILERPKMSSFQTATIMQLNDPAQGMLILDWDASDLDLYPKPRYYHNNKWYDIDDPDVQEIKTSSDRQTPKVENGHFRFEIADDLNDHKLIMAKGFVGTTGSSSTSVQISNQTQGWDMLSSSIVIPSGQYHAYGTVNAANDHVITGDRIWIDLDTVGTGIKGLGFILTWELDVTLP